MVMLGEMLSGVIHRLCIGCVYGKEREYVVVQFYPWFKFYYLLFWGMVMYDNHFETKKNKI